VRQGDDFRHDRLPPSGDAFASIVRVLAGAFPGKNGLIEGNATA
jgi:hypothetical protein